MTVEATLLRTRPHTELVRGVLPILLCSVLWGTVGIISIAAPAGASPLSVGALGMLLAGVLMQATRPGARRLLLRSRGHVRTLIIAGSFSLLTYPLAFFPAVRTVGVAMATVITLGSAPLFSGLIARFIGRERLTRRWLRCAPIAVAGTAMLVLGGGASHVKPLGVVLALIPGLAYASASAVAARLIGLGHASKDAYGAMFGTAAIWCVPVLAVGGVAWVASPRGMGVVLFYGCVTNTLCYTLFGSALRYIPATTATTLTLVEGAVGALLGVAVHGERLAPVAWFGLLVLGFALVMLSLPRRDDTQKDNVSGRTPLTGGR